MRDGHASAAEILGKHPVVPAAHPLGHLCVLLFQMIAEVVGFAAAPDGAAGSLPATQRNAQSGSPLIVPGFGTAEGVRVVAGVGALLPEGDADALGKVADAQGGV